MPAVVLASPLGAVSARRAVVPNGTREMARNATALPTRSSRFPLACRAERVSGENFPRGVPRVFRDALRAPRRAPRHDRLPGARGPGSRIAFVNFVLP